MLIIYLSVGGILHYIIFWKNFHWHPNKITVICAIICMLIPISFRSFCIFRTPHRIINMFLSTYVIQDILTKRTEWEEMATALAHPILPEQLNENKPQVSSNPLLGILILGESATRNHWQSYGYSRPTTPCIEAKKNEIFFFHDVLTCASTTSVSLKYIFTQATLQNVNNLNCTIFDIYMAMNWDVKLLSAQRCWSNTSNRKQALFFHSIQSTYYLHDHVKHYYDMDLFPIFKSEISKSSSIPTLFVFHLMGSHSDFKDRYPASFTRFRDKQIMNDEKTPEMQNTQKMTNSHVDEYDNSIAYTDFLLGSILDELQKLDSPMLPILSI